MDRYTFVFAQGHSDMHGRGVALGAGTILNALATGVGSAFALDIETTATIDVTTENTRDSTVVCGKITGSENGDTQLIERCVELAIEAYGSSDTVYNADIQTNSNIPMAAGLKSSSAAANATILATADAFGITPDLVSACRLGVRAARDVGVTITGAFDDASASMLGGVTVTNNNEDTILAHDAVEWDVVVWTPPERAYTADADVEQCANIASMAELVADLALDNRYTEAMTLNGLAFSAALGFDPTPAVEAMPYVGGVSLSGTGPSVVAVADRNSETDEIDLEAVTRHWRNRGGTVWETTTRPIRRGSSVRSDEI
ncbi:MAG: shikimate kinase [Haloquadratum walsbyi J07HQW2]|uniref:Shikimate kinase n=2 Tax=Haloquadratum walsbyi TaxID=293091 RepID=U1NE03_9EURY|nr:MAG: shikimate kinase [Haloquadratum walsbyi J07HQW2]